MGKNYPVSKPITSLNKKNFKIAIETVVLPFVKLLVGDISILFKLDDSGFNIDSPDNLINNHNN